MMSDLKEQRSIPQNKVLTFHNIQYTYNTHELLMSYDVSKASAE